MTQRNRDIIQAVNYWQNCKGVHPLTCGNDSNHSILKPQEKDGKVVLVCPDCDYVQDYIPEHIFRL